MGVVMSELSHLSNQIKNSIMERVEDSQTRMAHSESEENFEWNPDFVFPDSDSDNGLYFNGIYVPEEIVISIFSYVPCNEILRLGAVCKRWYNILRMHSLWVTLYRRKYNKIPKPLPWYTFYALFSTNYFNNNLLKNVFGEEEFKSWVIVRNGGNRFAIEKTPLGCEPFPPELKKAGGCFVTSYGVCCKIQKVDFTNRVVRYVVKHFKPHIHVSEWVAGRFDCGGSYNLEIALYDTYPQDDSIPLSDDSEEDDLILGFPSGGNLRNVNIGSFLLNKDKIFKYKRNEAVAWTKIELLLENYPDDVRGFEFRHCGVDDQFWRGHYGPKMAGAQVVLLFDSMEPVEDDTSQINMDDALE